MYEIRFLLLQMRLLTSLLAPPRGRGTRRDQRGASAAETAIIVGLLAGLAIAVGAIIVNKFTSTAESIPTE